ncbi:MAG: YetF domain-containing protein [Rhodococcus sp. (in: high G+C Gram-positive bacteria)]
MWFDSWSDLGRVLLVGTAAYVFLVVTLRVSGKRTLAKLNAFDLVVTVALGSTLATILLSSDVSWLEGATALVLLATLQYVAALISSRWHRGNRVLTAQPTLLVRDGRLLTAAMTSQRISTEQIHQAVRATGIGGVDLVAAVVLESDGSLSVVPSSDLGDGSALADVPGTAPRT